MPPHPYITETEKLLMVRMSEEGLNVADIVRATHRSLPTVYRVLALYRDTGDVVMRNLLAGRRRTLSGLDSQV